MFKSKCIFSLLIVFIIAFTSIYSQENAITTIIDSGYTCIISGGKDGIEYLIIKTLAEENTSESKLVSIEYMRDAIKRDIASKNAGFYSSLSIDDIFDIIKYLAFEGTIVKKREGNIIVCNFPDVRLEAVKLLGELNIIEARMTLIEVLRYENDVSVLRETIRSLFLNWNDFYNDDEIDIIINAIRYTYIIENDNNL